MKGRKEIKTIMQAVKNVMSDPREFDERVNAELKQGFILKSRNFYEGAGDWKPILFAELERRIVIDDDVL